MAAGPRVPLQLALGILLTLGGLQGARWIAQTTPPPPPAPPRETPAVGVETRTLTAGRLERSARVHGLLEATTRSHLALSVGGSVAELHPNWKRGARVAAGDLLLRLDDSLAQAAAARAEAGRVTAEAALAQVQVTEASTGRALELSREALELAQAEVARFERLDLEESGLVATADRARAARVQAALAEQEARTAASSAVAAVRVAEARLAEAVALCRETAEHLEQHRVRAPFAGVLEEEPPALGTWIAPGLPIATLLDPADWRARVRMPLDEASTLEHGLTAHLEGAGLPPEGLSATVGARSVAGDPRSRSVLVDLELELPPALRAGAAGLHGLPVVADVDLPDLEEVLVLSRGEIVWRDGVALALVVARSGDELRAEGRSLELGRRSGDRVVVRAGLAPGDRLITSPLSALTPGSLVTLTSAEPASEGAPR